MFVDRVVFTDASSIRTYLEQRRVAKVSSAEDCGLLQVLDQNVEMQTLLLTLHPSKYEIKPYTALPLGI